MGRGMRIRRGIETGIDWDWDSDRDWDWDSDRNEGENMDKDCDWERDEGRTEDERRGTILRQRTRGTKGVEERKKLAGEEVVPGVQVSASFLSRFFSLFFRAFVRIWHCLSPARVSLRNPKYTELTLLHLFLSRIRNEDGYCTRLKVIIRLRAQKDYQVKKKKRNVNHRSSIIYS